MKNERGRFATLAHTQLALGPVFLDIETTGLDVGTQALEIDLVNAHGGRIFETHLRPTIAIGPAAATVHGISNEDLARVPSQPDIAQQSQHHVSRHPLVIFNTGFGTRILKQAVTTHNDPASWLDSLAVYCAMWFAAGHYGPTDHYDTISLPDAVSQTSLRWIGGVHSAATDAVMAARVVNNIAGYWHEFQCEMSDDAGGETA